MSEELVRLQGSCYGCGLQLQTQESDVAGYVDPETYASSKQHGVRHLNMLLCERCQQLAHGRMIPAVEDFSSRYTGGQQTRL